MLLRSHDVILCGSTCSYADVRSIDMATPACMALYIAAIHFAAKLGFDIFNL